MNAPNERLEEFYAKFREKTSILEFLQGLAIETYPKVVPAAPVVEVNLHHSFITTVYFPEGSRLLKVVASFTPKHFVYRGNILEIQPKKDFEEGNAVCYYEINGRKRAIQLFFKQVNPYDRKNPENGVFYPVVVLTEQPVLSPAEVIEAYKETYGRLPASTFFKVNGVVYRIEPNERYGNVKVGRTVYLVVPLKLD